MTTNQEEIDALKNDVEDMEGHLRKLENENLMRLTGPLAASLARLHTGLNMAVLELNVIRKMIGE